MHDLVKEVILSERAMARGYFNPTFVRQLLERHERGTWDYSSEIFRLLMLELWHREYIDAPANVSTEAQTVSSNQHQSQAS